MFIGITSKFPPPKVSPHCCHTLPIPDKSSIGVLTAVVKIFLNLQITELHPDRALE